MAMPNRAPSAIACFVAAFHSGVNIFSGPGGWPP
jgi:hypothetical protein